MSTKKEKYPVCPDCGKSHYQYRHSTTTCMGRSPTYINGKMIGTDPNVTTHTYHCLECNKDFQEKEGGLQFAKGV